MDEAARKIAEWIKKTEKAKQQLQNVMKDVADAKERRLLTSAITQRSCGIKNFLSGIESVQGLCTETLKLVNNEKIVNTLTEKCGPLFKYVVMNRVDLVKMKLEQGADVNEMNSKRPVFHEVLSCYYKSDFKMVRLFLQYNVDVNIKDKEGNSALHVIGEGDYCLDVAKLLINAKADVNSLNNQGHTPLYSAVFGAKDLKLICLFLENGGLLVPDKKCVHALHTSDQRSLSDAFDHLMYCELDLNSTDDEGNTVLHNAMKCCNMEFAKILIQAGANVHQVNQDDYTPLQLVLNERSLRYQLNNKAAVDVIEMCFDFNLDPNMKNTKDQTILRITVDLMSHEYFKFDVDLVEPVLKAIAKLEMKKSNVNKTDLDLIQSTDSLKSNYKKYKQELINLKTCKISKNATLFNFLTDNFSDVLTYAANTNLSKFYKESDLKENFPVYSNNIINRFNEAILMCKLKDESSLILSKIFKSFPMSVIKHEIVCYLSKSDMLKLTYKPT